MAGYPQIIYVTVAPVVILARVLVYIGYSVRRLVRELMTPPAPQASS